MINRRLAYFTLCIFFHAFIQLLGLLIIWICADIKSIIFMVMMISIFVTILNIYNSFINTEEEYIKLMKSFKCNDFIVLNKVVIPSNINNIVSSFKVNVSMTLIGLLPPVGEKIFFNKCYSRY